MRCSDATLTSEAEATVAAAIATIRAQIPFFVRLTPAERRNLPHVTPASQGTLEQMVTFIANHPTAIGGDFDRAKFSADIALQKAWAPIFAQITSLFEDANDTNLALNADLYHALLLAYAGAKVANRDGAYDNELSIVRNHFASRGRRKNKAKKATPPPA